MLFNASAPGSLMLLGEYGVLHGGRALVAAVNRRMSVELQTRHDTKIMIHSQLGQLECDLSQISIQQPFQFVTAILKKYQPSLPCGCDINIRSEFSDQMGFASSAAVTVSLLKVMHAWLNLSVSDEELIQEARDIVRAVQGVGSGADVAACVLGGVVEYRAEPFVAKKMNATFPITVVYSGSKTKTVDAIQYVKQRFYNREMDFKTTVNGIDACVAASIHALQKNNMVEFGSVWDQQQALMQELQVNTPIIDDIIACLRNDVAISGAKISGSGLGDCVIGLGNAKPVFNQANAKWIEDIAITLQGVSCG